MTTTYRTFPARYPGPCAYCGERINTGDTITTDGDFYRCHAACFDLVAQPETSDQ